MTQLVHHRTSIRTHLYCDRFCNNLCAKDFLFYDKDGFELNLAEQKYYRAMNFQLEQCLNHHAFSHTWYTSTDPRLIVDHSIILYRCGYQGDAERQLAVLKESVPQASLLLNTVPKWGFDFALDSIDEYGDIYEVVHIEYDTNIFLQFVDELNKIRERIDSMDWHDAADYILRTKSEWQSLRGFAQNDWKARTLLHWSRAEFTEKAI